MAREKHDPDNPTHAKLFQLAENVRKACEKEELTAFAIVIAPDGSGSIMTIGKEAEVIHGLVAAMDTEPDVSRIIRTALNFHTRPFQKESPETQNPPDNG